MDIWNFPKLSVYFLIIDKHKCHYRKISKEVRLNQTYREKGVPKMSDKVCFDKLGTEEKLSVLYDEMRKMTQRQVQMMEDLEYMGKQLRRVEIIQDDTIADGITAIAANIADVSKKMDSFINMETVLNTIKSDVKIIKEL